jgi:hypothetical protein
LPVEAAQKIEAGRGSAFRGIAIRLVSFISFDPAFDHGVAELWRRVAVPDAYCRVRRPGSTKNGNQILSVFPLTWHLKYRILPGK